MKKIQIITAIIMIIAGIVTCILGGCVLADLIRMEFALVSLSFCVVLLCINCVLAIFSKKLNFPSKHS